MICFHRTLLYRVICPGGGGRKTNRLTYCKHISDSYYFLLMQNALQFLAVLFFDCRLSFRCFHCIASLSVVCGCGRKPARCRMKFQVPLTAFLMHPHISEPCRYAVKHWKDRLNSKRKQSSLVLQHSVLKNNRKPGYPIQ